MKSSGTRRFWDRYASLPDHVKRQARFAYRLFRDNPQHPGLRFKRIHARQAVCSIRIGLGYRAIGSVSGDEVVWFWIGTHADFDQMVKDL